MPFIDFDQIERKALAPGHSSAQGEVVTGTQIQMGRVRFAKGYGADEHVHPHEQMVYVLEGRLLVVSGGEERELRPGQGVHHPPGVPHRVTALEDTVLISCKPFPGDG